MGFGEGYSLVEHLFWEFSRLTNPTLLSLEEAAGEAYSALHFLKDQDLHTLLREVGSTLGYLPGDPGFGFLTNQHLPTLSRELGWALGHSAGEPGLGLHHWLSEEDSLVVCCSP